VLDGGRSRFDIINRSQCYSHMPRRRAESKSVNFQLILKDVKHSRVILKVSESQVDVLFIEIQSSDPVASSRVV